MGSARGWWVGLILVAGLVLALVAGVADGAAEETKDFLKACPEAMQRWREARFGLFVHWGPVSLKGTEIGWSRGSQVPIEEYDNLYKQFNPTKFDADEWVKTAKEAGMKYLVITTKHHDGFCLWPSEQTDYDIGETPFKRDVLKELSDACRRHGLAFGTYYSVCDWYHPDFPRGSPGGKTRKPNPNLDRYEQYLRSQVRELIRNYGPLLTLWFDVPQEFDTARGQGVIDFVRSLQPDILINNRTGAPGDYDTPEQQIGKFQVNRPWETCMTICRQWAWKPDDLLKTLQECIQILVRTVGGDGNLLLNVGPMPDGRIEPRQVARLKEMGDWLKQYGGSIYGTRGGPFKPGPYGASTHKGNRIYLHILQWPGEAVHLPAIPRKVTAAGVLGGGKAEVEQTDQGITVRVPEADRKELDTIIVLDLDGPAGDLEPVDWSSGSLAAGKKATASNVFMKQVDEYGPAKAVDGDSATRWATDAGTSAAWLEVDLGKPTVIGRLVIDEAVRFGGGRIRRFRLEVEKEGAWEPVLEGTTIGQNFEKKFGPVTARRARLNILEASEGPTIWEFQLFGQ